LPVDGAAHTVLIVNLAENPETRKAVRAWLESEKRLGLGIYGCAAAEARALHAALSDAGHPPLAVEMEGAAVAQVCHDYGIPFAAVRTISDRADDTAHVDFPQFVREVASRYALAIIDEFVRSLSTSGRR